MPVKDISKISKSGVKYVEPDELIRQDDVRREVKELKRLFRKNGKPVTPAQRGRKIAR